MTTHDCVVILQLSVCIWGFSHLFLFHGHQKLRSFFNDTWMERYKQPISPGVCTIVWSIAVAIFSVGGMVGSFSVGVMANRFGR